MDTTELIQRVRRVELKTRGLSDRIFSGEYHSAFKGRGMAFSENREYQHGDEIRTIDWNVTARMGHPYVKVFEEERELTVFLLLDVVVGTKSTRYGGNIVSCGASRGTFNYSESWNEASRVDRSGPYNRIICLGSGQRLLLQTCLNN